MSMDIVTICEAPDLEAFLRALFPPHWSPVIRVIMESGATMAAPGEQVKWAPRWSKIPRTTKGGPTPEIAALKSCMYRAHDALHQLWGLPTPARFSDDERFMFKRAQMCGEVSVLLIEEFLLGAYLWDELPALRSYIDRRCAVPMLKSVFRGRTEQEMAARLDGLLHRSLMPQWARDDAATCSFVAYYVPMLERDRVEIDHNFKLLHALPWNRWEPISSAPSTRYDATRDGLELTVWMIDDFKHVLRSGDVIDRELQAFNQRRRERIVLPDGWGQVAAP